MAGFALLIICWQLLVSLAAVQETALPRPLSVVEALSEHGAVLWEHSQITLIEILLGFVLSAVSGFLIALLIDSSRILYRLLYPLMIVAQAVPKLALVPVILIWFGFGRTSNAVIALLISVFPVIVNTLHGFQSVDRRYVELGRVMAGSHFMRFRKIRLPAAMPSIFTGLKLGMSFATVGAVAGEIFAGSEGLGYVVSSAAGALDTPLAYAAIVVISALGLILYYLMLWLEKRLLPWASGDLVTGM
ncbi:ABC transporter permease [Streptomyces sp. NBC_01334]|uniref:ABC transporter permease n=1 Tax=Streptomyces sp. NBC_01334 TaxID=2903827 RepID=UPI002E1201EF|nr:ABC transporter permease [Streptomyces sp. NBC_01334]